MPSLTPQRLTSIYVALLWLVFVPRSVGWFYQTVAAYSSLVVPLTTPPPSPFPAIHFLSACEQQPIRDLHWSSQSDVIILRKGWCPIYHFEITEIMTLRSHWSYSSLNWFPVQEGSEEHSPEVCPSPRVRTPAEWRATGHLEVCSLPVLQGPPARG